MAMQFPIYLKPDKRVVKRVTVKNSVGAWQSIYERTWPFVQSVEIRNLNVATTLFIADDDEKPTGDNYDQVGPSSSITEEYDPAQIYANTNTGSIICLVIIKFFSVNYMKRLLLGINEPMPNKTRPKDHPDNIFKYYYKTDAIFGKVPESK